MTPTPKTQLFGVLVTFRRPLVLEATLGKLAAQTRSLDHLIVVDNDSDPDVARIVSRHNAGPGTVNYIDAKDNLGPAGGYALGMELALDGAGDDDWVFLLDDDDPPFFDNTLEKAERFTAHMKAADPQVGGVGVSGGRFSRKSGRVVRVGDEELTGPVLVDHITGGGLPAYRIQTVRTVGSPRADLFFGFEELEYGLRMTEAGFRLYADGDVWLARRNAKRALGLLPPEEVSKSKASTNSFEMSPPSWRRYYSLRNLIVILRQYHAPGTALRITVTRGIVKPLLNLVVTPSLARKHLAMNSRAIRDGWLNRLGRTVAPTDEV